MLRGVDDLTWTNLRHFLVTNDDDDDDEKEVIVEPVEAQGVLSEVWNVKIGNEYDWIVKFPRNSSQKELFRVEANFYRYIHKGGCTKLSSRFPFSIPHAIHTSETCIIIKRIKNVTTTTHSLLQGCPNDHLKPILSCLAKMHLRYWKNHYFGDDERARMPNACFKR